MMSGQNMICKAYEIWLAYVVFDDGQGAKKRPILIIESKSGKKYQVKMTGSAPRDEFEHQLVFWSEAGLSKQTTIRTGKIDLLYENDLIHKIGDLHSQDVIEFQRKFRRAQGIYARKHRGN